MAARNKMIREYILNNFWCEDVCDSSNNDIFAICEYLYNAIQTETDGDLFAYAQGLSGHGVFDFWYSDYYHMIEYAAPYIGFTAKDNETAARAFTREIYNYVRMIHRM